MKSFTDKQAAIGLIVIGIVACILMNDDYNTKKADEAYRAKVVAQRKASQDKAFNDLAARGEFMTTFAAVQK
jgi:hypothetical protein